jgi:hypothetical protein
MKLLARFKALPWPQKVTCLVLVPAVTWLMLGGIASSLCYFVVAFMGWTPFFVANAAKGNRTLSGKGRLIIGVGMFILGGQMLPNLNSPKPNGGEVAAAEAVSKASEGGSSAACDFGSRKTEVDFLAKSDVDLHVAPKADAASVPWKIGDETVAFPMEEGRTVREHCRVGNWSKIHTPSSEDVPRLYGWVPSSELRKVATANDGRRIYTTADFEWPKGRVADRTAAVKVMNRIMKERPECETLDHHSLVLNKTSKDDEFSIPCFTKGEMVSFSFIASDATNGSSFAKVDPIEETDAVVACRSAVLTSATHPSTVGFPLGYDFRPDDQGRAEVMMSATAKNGFNLELTYKVHCSFHGSKLVDFGMSETAG